MIEALLGEGGRFVSEVLFPLNQTGDREGCTRHPDGSVTTPSGFKEAYKQFVESGWATLSMPPEFGGQGLPHVISSAFGEYLISSNMAFAMYNGLAQGAVSAILAKGSQEQKEKYLRSEEHTSELQSLMRISYAVFCLKKKNTKPTIINTYEIR